MTGYVQTSITIDTGYTGCIGYGVVEVGEMFPAFGRELARIRVESLQGEGGPRSAKSPGRVRRMLGHAFVVAGEQLLGHRHDRRAARIGGCA
ncbi:MAG: hypothetical protein ACXWDU_02645 [Actinomycetota bacterium]